VKRLVDFKTSLPGLRLFILLVIISGNRERTPLALLALGLVISGIVLQLIDFVGSRLEKHNSKNMIELIT